MGNAGPDDLTRKRAVRSGKWVILAMVGLALAAAAFSWSFRQQAMRRTMAFWGGGTARLIAQAPHVEGLRLAPADAADRDEAGRLIVVEGRRFRVVAHRDMDHVRGLTHLRHALLEDVSFDFRAAEPSEPPHWEYAVRFGDGDRVATVLVSLADARLAVAGRPGTVSMAPIAKGVGLLLRDEAFGRPGAH